MTKEELILQSLTARKELNGAIGLVTEPDFERAKIITGWTLKDVLLHILAWDEEAMRVLSMLKMNVPEIHFDYTISPREDFAAWNAEQIAKRGNLTPAQIFEQMARARRDLLDTVSGISDQVLSRPFETPWGMKLNGSQVFRAEIDHDLEHAAQIRSWAKKIARWRRARAKLRKTKGSTKDTKGHKDSNTNPS
jgi:uncharacterized damage-inducible protein DinB